MRHYSFGNFYLSSIQQGIQGAHGLMELFVKYPTIDLREVGISLGENPPEHIVKASQKSEMLYEWANEHQTMICLNGGMNSDLLNLYGFLVSDDNPYPFAHFAESKEALDKMLTNISIILPEKIYEASAEYRKAKFKDSFFIDYDNDFSRFERELVVKMSSYGLAK